MGDHPNARLTKRALEQGFHKGDFEVLNEIFDPDIVWHEPGHNQISEGIRQGHPPAVDPFGLDLGGWDS